MSENIKKVYIKSNIIKGLTISLLFTFISLFILSALLTYTNLSENMGNACIIIINAISILLGSGIATLKQKKNGIIKGALCGFIYIATIYLIASLIELNFSLNINSIIMILTSIFAGVIGGIIGVNLNK